MANISYMVPRREDRLDEYRGAPEPAGHEPQLTLRDLFRTIWHRKTLIVAVIFAICTLTTLWLLQVVPLYVATSAVAVETRRENVVKIESVLEGVNPDYYTNETEAAIIRSRANAAKVVDQLGLVNNPLFNPELAKRKPSLFGRLLDTLDPGISLAALTPEWVTDLLNEVKPAAPAPSVPAADPKQLLREQVIDRFLGAVKVDPSERSRVITIAFTSEDPSMAALGANTLANTYILQSVNAKYDATARASDWLNDRVAEMRRRVEESSQAVDAYRREIGIVDLQNQSTLLSQQVAELNAKLITARSERAEAEARYEQVERLLESPGGISSAAAVLQSPLIQKLREQEAQIVREIADLKTQVKSDHPQMILKRSELADLDDKISKEVAKVGLSLKNELEITRIRERTLVNEVGELQQKLAGQNQAEVKLHALESEANANKQLYDTMLERFKETGVQEQGLQQADARLISPAAVPATPSYPKKTLILSLAFAGSALLGILLVLTIEHLDNGFRTLEQVETMTGAPGLGMVPRPSGWNARGQTPSNYMLNMPNSSYGEAIRTIRTGLLLSNVEMPPKVVLLTSSLPGEGKSEIAVSLARAAAKAGQRTLVIDCDLRHPTLHVKLGVPNGPGLVGAVTGLSKLEDVIDIDERSGCHYITAGSGVPSPTDFLGSDAMRRILVRVREVYDLVVIDTPPVLVVSDVLVLLRQVDKTLFVTHWGKTPRDAVVAALRNIVEAGGDVAGMVLNQVNLQKQSRYRYGNAGHYGSYRKYYIE
jgi:capsular exopolysaccharide synthesis family protein